MIVAPVQLNRETDDRPPYFLKTEKFSPHSSVFDVNGKDLDGVLKF